MAEKKKINPYDIIGAPELERLVGLDPFPRTLQDLSRVQGFSDWKIRSFGSELIKAILLFQERHADDYKALQDMSSKEGGSKGSSVPIYLTVGEGVAPCRPTVKLFHPSYDEGINAASPICNLIDRRTSADVSIEKVVSEIDGDFLSLLAKNEELLMMNESKVMLIDGAIGCQANNTDIHNENTTIEASMGSRLVTTVDRQANSSNSDQLDRAHDPSATPTVAVKTAINSQQKPSDNAWRKRQGMISGLSAYKARKDPKLNRAPTM